MPRRPSPPILRALAAVAACAGLALTLGACESGPASTPPISPGTAAAPREVNVIARDYAFVPSVVDLVPGETVLLHVLNGGLETHEAILGDAASQQAWEEAQAAFADRPPGPTPFIPPPPGFDGIRIVAGSGERVDATWTVPADAADAGPWFVGCHIPGHWGKGMVVPVRFMGPDGRPRATDPAPSSSASAIGAR